MPRGNDENDNGTVVSVYNQIDANAAMTRASFVLKHHATKGIQSEKTGRTWARALAHNGGPRTRTWCCVTMKRKAWSCWTRQSGLGNRSNRSACGGIFCCGRSSTGWIRRSCTARPWARALKRSRQPADRRESSRSPRRIFDPRPRSRIHPFSTIGRQVQTLCLVERNHHLAVFYAPLAVNRTRRPGL